MKFLDKDTWIIKLNQNGVIFNETELKHITDRLDAISNDILAMRRALPVSYPIDRGGVVNDPKFKRPFFNAVNEATRLKAIKKMIVKGGVDL